ncbi:regulator of microtubule dynamics protein 1-like isoform X1 [Diorhabda sublineata]|uniref:regulator of microtubule dynamics protein 1-like isoform X1 n=2 Tax=Diorhabda sublineata TaxID=1163346 RepID=UPI0024E137F7|nr:regulator of microtubule dynamics protein 1-like isoform X1 [Diorhabda sublineata]
MKTMKKLLMAYAVIIFNKNKSERAAFLGVISAAGMFLVEHYRHDKVRHAMAKDLARLDQELSQVRRELDQLLVKTSEKSNRSKKTRIIKKASSVVSASTADEYLSSTNMDSSDLEFYDLSDDENVNNTNTLEDSLDAVDAKLDSGILRDIEESLNKLTDLCIEHPENCQLLWRIGKAHKKLADLIEDKDMIKEHVTKGIEACESALKLKEDEANTHKWYAILLGNRSEFGSISEKISDGFLFKKHVERALALNPSDGTLHHMMGQFNYEAASLSWFERKAATALFGVPPNSTYPEALKYFIEAEKHLNYDWKSNKLMIAKCKIKMEDYKEAVDWLEKASKCARDALDDKDDTEIKTLLQKYNSYR